MAEKEMFSYWVMQPRQMEQKDIAKLEAIVSEFPFCQLAHTLTAKAVSMIQPASASNYIPKAAVYALSRQALRSLLEDDLEWSETLLSRMTDGLPALRKKGVTPPEQTVPEQIVKEGPAPVPFDPTALAAFTVEQDLLRELTVPGEQSGTRKSAQELIAQFIRTDPVIGAMKPETVVVPGNEDLSLRSQLPVEDIATESFAKILVMQGKTERAIAIYEKLMLKIPDKKGYFAEKIRNLK